MPRGAVVKVMKSGIVVFQGHIPPIVVSNCGYHSSVSGKTGIGTPLCGYVSWQCPGQCYQTEEGKERTRV